MGAVVLGMHRSGTSAVTQLLEHAGLATCDPRHFMKASPFNPHGNRENAALVSINDRLLATLGGTWSAPPPSEPGDWSGARFEAFRSEGRDTFASTMPERGWVWKDPRLCMVLPWWDSALGRRAPVVLVRRGPLEVATSLARRNEFSLPLGLALWERYVRSALASAAGHDAVVVDYDDVVGEPERWMTWLRAELEGAGVVFGPRASADELATVIDPRLRHGVNLSGAGGTSGALSPEQAALYDTFRQLDRRATPFMAPQLPHETPWVTALLEERRGRQQRGQELESLHRRDASPRRLVSLAVRQVTRRATARLRHS